MTVTDFGSTPTDFYITDAFTATPHDYGRVVLDWDLPGGVWAQIQLVRNLNGYPGDETNGVVLYTGTAGTALTTFTDTDLQVARWVYYSLFVYDSARATWYRSGNARAYVPRDFNGGQTLYNDLPTVFRDGDYDTSLTTDPATGRPKSNHPLSAYMSILGYQADVIRNIINSTLDLYDASKVLYDLIPTILTQFNIKPEVEIGPEQYRRLLRNAIFLFQTKGTSACVHGLVSAITGYDSYLEPPTNLLWDRDHSDFVGGIGHWATGVAGCSVIWDPAVPGMRITAAATGSISTSFVTPDNVEYLGIVVGPSTPLSAVANIIASDTNASLVALQLDWYDKNNSIVGTVIGAPLSTKQGVAVRPQVSGAAPAGAVRAGLTIVILSSSIEIDSPSGVVFRPQVFLPGGKYGISGVFRSPDAVDDGWLLVGRSAQGGATSFSTTPIGLGSFWTVTQIQLNKSGAPLEHQPGRDIRIVLQGSSSYDETKIARLIDVLPKYLPLAATFTVLWDQPPPGVFTWDDVIVVGQTPYTPTTVVSKSLTARWQDRAMVSVLRQGLWRNRA